MKISIGTILVDTRNGIEYKVYGRAVPGGYKIENNKIVGNGTIVYIDVESCVGKMYTCTNGDDANDIKVFNLKHEVESVISYNYLREHLQPVEKKRRNGRA